MEALQRARVAVVGGGIAGLACARALLVEHPGLDVTVYEATARVGGKLALGEVAGVQVDLGAESMLNRRLEGTQLARSVGLADSVVHPSVSGAGVWARGAVRPLPATVMGVPVDLSEAGRSGILSRTGLARALLERRLPRLDVSEDVGVGVVVARRLGREVRDLLVEPLLGGVYAGRADEISMHAAVPELVRAVAHHGGLLAAARAVAAGARAPGAAPAVAPVFAGIRGGVARLPHAVVRDLEHRGAAVVTNAVVRELTRLQSGWRLTLGPAAAPTFADCDVVVVAVPAQPASRLLLSAAPSAASELRLIDYASMAVVTMAWRADQVDVDLPGTGFLVPPVDGRAVKAATYSSRKWAWLSGDVAVVRCSVGRHRDEAVLQRDDRELVETATMDLRAATGMRAPLLDAQVTRWGGALPQYAVGHVDRVRRIRAAVAEVPGLEVCGAAYDGVGIPAVIASGQAAATRVAEATAPAGTMES